MSRSVSLVITSHTVIDNGTISVAISTTHIAGIAIATVVVVVVVVML